MRSRWNDIVVRPEGSSRTAVRIGTAIWRFVESGRGLTYFAKEAAGWCCKRKFRLVENTSAPFSGEFVAKRGDGNESGVHIGKRHRLGMVIGSTISRNLRQT
jgi:hypothetical protein